MTGSRAEGGIQVEDRKIYEEIALRTEGDIYIGVVGPVRTRKIHLYQAVHGDSGHPQHRKCLPPGAGPG